MMMIMVVLELQLSNNSGAQWWGHLVVVVMHSNYSGCGAYLQYY